MVGRNSRRCLYEPVSLFEVGINRQLPAVFICTSLYQSNKEQHSKESCTKGKRKADYRLGSLYTGIPNSKMYILPHPIFMPATRTRQYSLEDISPYYVPGAPPPVLPILIAQTEIGKLCSHQKLLAQEEISAHKSYGGPGQDRADSNTCADINLGLLSTANDSRSRSITPDCNTGKIAPHENHEQHALNPEEKPIPKPVGEAGRPGRGGYSFESQVRWSKAQRQEIKVRFQESAAWCLTDITSEALRQPNRQRTVGSFYLLQVAVTGISSSCRESGNQINHSTILCFCSNDLQVAERFPIMHKYENFWPATDLVRLRLKYTSRVSRGAREKADAKLGKNLRVISQKE